jgi:hypothetical protein
LRIFIVSVASRHQRGLADGNWITTPSIGTGNR